LSSRWQHLVSTCGLLCCAAPQDLWLASNLHRVMPNLHSKFHQTILDYCHLWCSTGA
jgi:hypothetical protein